MGDPQVNDPLAARKAAAELRVRAALAAIQEAQALVDRAAQALCSVNGLCPEYERLGKLYEAVHRVWYVVRDKAAVVSRRGKLRLDHEPNEREAQWESLS
jgi:hypothetical protein